MPEEVVEEVEHQRDLLARALAAGHLTTTRLTGIANLDLFRELRLTPLGPGEAACLALASANGWSVACDDPASSRPQITLSAADFPASPHAYGSSALGP